MTWRASLAWPWVEPPVGIPNFWLVALRNNEQIQELITERDEPVLAHLVDITSSLPEGEGEQMGFVLDFHFSKNDFFSNAVVSKTYHMLDHEDPIPTGAEGTEIQWLPGKNLCVKVTRQQPKTSAKNRKPIIKTEPCTSFFSFFSPPEVPAEDEDYLTTLTEEDAEALQDAMTTDLDMGAIIKVRRCG